MLRRCAGRVASCACPEIARGARPEPEQRVVERRRAAARDPRGATSRRSPAAPRPPPRRPPARRGRAPETARRDRSARGPALRAAPRRASPPPTARPRRRAAQPTDSRSRSDAQRLVLEQRELPALDRLARARSRPPPAPAARAARRRGAPRHGSSRVGSPRRLGRRDAEHRPDPEGVPVEPLEDDRPGGGRSRGGEPERRDGVRQLGRRVRRRVLVARQLALELEHALRSGSNPKPVRRRDPAPPASATASSSGEEAWTLIPRPARPARRSRARRAAPRLYTSALFAVQRALELAVDAVERTVLPVEAAAASAVRTSNGSEDRPEQRPLLARTRGPRAPARRSRKPARGAARRGRCARPRAWRARTRGPGRGRGRAAGTRRSRRSAPRRCRGARPPARPRGRARRRRRGRSRAGRRGDGGREPPRSSL